MKIRLKWIDCFKCGGDGGFEFGYYDEPGWCPCPICGGTGRVQKPILVKENTHDKKM